MTAKVNRQGQVVLRTTAQEKLDIRAGDLLVVVVRDARGRIVLQKRPSTRARDRHNKSYLNPRPIRPAVLERIYSRPSAGWDKVEAEAVAISRRTLIGTRLEELSTRGTSTVMIFRKRGPIQRSSSPVPKERRESPG